MPTTTSQATLSGLRMNQPAIAAPGSKTQTAFPGLLLQVGDVAGMAARPDLRAPVERLQLAAVHREVQARGVARIGRFAADIRAVGLHRREFLAELEALALLPAGR